MPAPAPNGRPTVHAATRGAWRAWLAENHGTSAGVWLVSFKAATGKPRVQYSEAVEEALCFGWVDSKSKALDDERSLLWMCPRKPGSGWSRTNKERVARLERLGLLTDAGREAIKAAQLNGSWALLDSVEALEVPADLATALAENAEARRHYDAFPPSSQTIILTWIATAKRPATRARRVEETVRLAADDIRANHPSA